MDEGGVKSNDPHEPKSSTCLDRLFPFLDGFNLVPHDDDDWLDEICLKGFDGLAYKVPLATILADGERLYACLVHNNQDERILKLMSEHGLVRFDAWILLTAIKSRSQLTTILKTALVYKGAVGGNNIEFGKRFGEDLVRNTSISGSQVTLDFIRKMEDAQALERNGRKRLGPMQQRLQHLNDDIEAAKQNLALLEQERTKQTVSIRSIEEQVETAMEVQRNGATSIDP
ncbi:uncharacterized protein N0V89_005396 [Didymosphaeria variabile]|uniref:Uncharacterized protein n=1 Tax=Didymosphaeria variabile TaxID=1932322 RepID=A0A9W8XL95_9PLEO|nr:uncharacterized protein N0V89_005396 [Didymosphaeria variabile]KAJ4353666.1 hypothetical protein N0V89_005396 [Didymosphaeria variabile]